MFDVLNGLREVATYAAATGVSVGVLIGLGALAWFVASARPIAIAGAVTVTVGFGMFVYGGHLRGDEVQAQWDAANAAAAKARAERDAAITKSTSDQYQPQIAALQKEKSDLQKQADAYEKKLLAAKSTGANGACALGAGPLRLRASTHH